MSHQPSFEPADGGIAKLIRDRRTINDFRADPPPEAAVLQAIELARWAPNHKHTEPWRFHLIGPETAKAIVALNARLVAEKKGEEAAAKKREKWSAVPGWLAVTCQRSDDSVRAREDYAACCCAIQNLSLFLWSEGIGVKWSTGDVTRHPEFAGLLGFDPAEHDFVGLLWYGYPQHVPPSKRRDVSEIVRRLP
jgi:nitroreductase